MQYQVRIAVYQGKTELKLRASQYRDRKQEFLFTVYSSSPNSFKPCYTGDAGIIQAQTNN